MYYRDGGKGGRDRRGERLKRKEGTGKRLEGGGVVIVSRLFITSFFFFFFNHSTVCSIKVKPIER